MGFKMHGAAYLHQRPAFREIVFSCISCLAFSDDFFV